MLKATYALIKNDSNANYDFGVNAAGINPGGMPAGFSAAGGSVQGISFGVRHTF